MEMDRTGRGLPVRAVRAPAGGAGRSSGHAECGPTLRTASGWSGAGTVTTGAGTERQGRDEHRVDRDQRIHPAPSAMDMTFSWAERTVALSRESYNRLARWCQLLGNQAPPAPPPTPGRSWSAGRAETRLFVKTFRGRGPGTAAAGCPSSDARRLRMPGGAGWIAGPCRGGAVPRHGCFAGKSTGSTGKSAGEVPPGGAGETLVRAGAGPRAVPGLPARPAERRC